MIIKMNLTVRNYKILRMQALNKGADIYPSYEKVLLMKELCTPKNIEFSEDGTEAKISIKDILDHRISRILNLNPEIIEEMERIAKIDPDAKFTLFYKYGCGNHICNFLSVLPTLLLMGRVSESQ